MITQLRKQGHASDGTEVPAGLPTQNSVTVVQHLTELKPFLSDLDNLVNSALEPNVFYEPWMLIPALNWLVSIEHLRLVLVFRNSPTAAGSPPVLIGFFPLEFADKYNHFPVKTARLWKYKYCYLCTPLVHRDHADEAFKLLFEWLGSEDSECRILEIKHIAGEGPVHEIVIEQLWNSSRPSIVDARWVRPCLKPDLTAESYLERVLSSRHRKDLEKKERKLSRIGRVEYVAPTSSSEADRWIEEFIAMEAQGRRGKRGVACASQSTWVSFFREAMREGWQLGRLDFLGLRLDSRFIALKINLRCQQGSFAYMIAYDEQYSSYSPGLLLEIENIRRFHSERSFLWMDSCADQNSPLFTRVWAEKRTIETLLVSTGSKLGDFWISVIPFGHFLRRALVPPSTP
jgi:hypothetical protein